MVISMALAALLLAMGFLLATALASYMMGEEKNARLGLSLAWLFCAPVTIFFAFLAGNLWQ